MDTNWSLQQEFQLVLKHFIIQQIDKIRIIIKYLKIFKTAQTCFGSQGIRHQGDLYSAWLKLQ